MVHLTLLVCLKAKLFRRGDEFDAISYLKRDPVTNELRLKENHIYYLQVQCQLGTTGLDWCGFFVTSMTIYFFCQRIKFDPVVFQKSKDQVDNFYFNYFLGRLS